MPEIRTKHAVVGLSELKKGMRILTFLEFAPKYHSLDEKTVRWLAHNFKGSKVDIVRRASALELEIGDMLPGDNLQKIHDLPSQLEKITLVSERLIQELESRGFLKFRVERKIKVLPLERQKNQADMQRSARLAEQVQASIITHEEASEAVENLLDNAREGAFNISEVSHYVDAIAGDGKAEAISAMASLKESDQTYAHCVEVAAIFHETFYKINSRTHAKVEFHDPKEALLGGFLHDFGKARVPKDVLDSTQKFEKESKEMRLLKSHPSFGAELLTDLNMPDYIINMAHYHHVKLDPTMKSSYPMVDPKKVRPATYLLSMVDIYQALVGRRRYKKSWTPADTMKYLDALAGVEYPQDLFYHFMAVMGKYPISSLVELNDGRQGFVMNVPEMELERPQVVVVKNAKGEFLTHHDFVDLALVREMSITKTLDAQEEYGDVALDIFANLKPS